MDKYNKFKEQLSVYEDKSKLKIILAILSNILLRVFMTKSFDFIFTLSIIVLIPIYFGGFSVSVFIISLISHFILWISVYRLISKYLGSDDEEYNDLTLKIRILKDIFYLK